MNKSKAALIGIVLLGLLGYGAFRVARPLLRPNSDEKLQRLVGKPVPDWDIPSQFWINTKKPVTPEDLKGSVTLIDFFRINCPHCAETAPLIDGLHKKYSAKGLKVIAFHSPGRAENENDWKQVQEALQKKWKPAYPVAFDEKRKLFTEKFNGSLYPTVVVLDRNGIVRFTQVGTTDQNIGLVEVQIQQELGK